jgi:peptidase M28-like protein
MTPEAAGRAVLLAAAAAIAARAGDPAATSKAGVAEQALIDAVSADRAARTVRDLVAFGARMGGTPSGDRSAAWVKHRLEEIGLTVEDVEDPPKETHEEISFEARLLQPGNVALDAWPVGFSPSLQPSELAVLVAPPSPPAGGAPWALLTDEPPGSAMQSAIRAGARAVLSDNPREEGRYLDWAPATELLPDGSARIPAFTLSLNAGKRIRKGLQEGGVVRVRLALDARLSSGRPRTIVATLAGTAPGWYLVCAHGDSDSGGPGADDNASGVASLLEVAEALHRGTSLGLLPASRPAVRFVVWGSEGHSTESYARAHLGEMDSLLGVFNFDETAEATEKDALYFEGNDVPWNRDLLLALMAVAADHAGRDDFPREFTTNPSLGGTDAYVFVPKAYHGSGIVAAKVPATTVFTAAWGTPEVVRQTPGWQSKAWSESGTVRIDYSRYYHSSGDVPGAATDPNAGRMARCARVVAAALLRLMTGRAVRELPAS